MLEGSALDWYSLMLTKYTLNSEWNIWKENFCETYADRSWAPVKNAILYKYLGGSLLDYAFKKERMLLDVNKKIDNNTLVNLMREKT